MSPASVVPIASLATPCPIPYQGSKRKLAAAILSYCPDDVDTLFEPFAGSAAISLAAAASGRAKHFVIADLLASLSDIWHLILQNPARLADGYESLWQSQLPDPAVTFNRIRDEFNRDGDPAKLLYLVARCVKNAIRFNPRGQFNQSPDHRRLGMKPSRMRREIFEAHELLCDRTSVQAADYSEVLKEVSDNDLVYMDPPYQGVSTSKDPRYAKPLNIHTFEAELRKLNAINASYMVSFDGQCGTKTYGRELAADLRLCRIQLLAGRSSQASLLGRSDVTIESLYLSPALLNRLRKSKGNITTPEHDQLLLLEGYG